MIWNNKSESEATRGLSLSTEKEYELCTDCGVLWLDRRQVRTPKSPIAEKRWRKIYAGLRGAWEACQTRRDGSAVWISRRNLRSRGVVDGENRAIGRARRALHLLRLSSTDEPFAAIIFCTSDRQKVDKRMRSKWSRALRYAAEYKTTAEPWPRLFSVRAASTNVPHGSPAASGDAVAAERGAVSGVDPLRKSRLGYVHPANVIGVVAEIGNNCHAKRRSGRTLPAEEREHECVISCGCSSLSQPHSGTTSSGWNLHDRRALRVRRQTATAC